MSERNISENNQFYLFLGQNPESPNGIFPNIIIFGIKSKMPERNISDYHHFWDKIQNTRTEYFRISGDKLKLIVFLSIF